MEYKESDKGNRWKLGTWNVKTLYQKGKLENVLMEMERLDIKILGLTETRWLEAGCVNVRNGKFIFSGGNNHISGVGVIILGNLSKQIQGFWPISDRVILVKIRLNKKIIMNVIQIYAPTTDNTDEEVEEFYSQVDNAMKQCKNREINIVMGDVNAKVGCEPIEDIVGSFGMGKINPRGETWVSWCKL